MPDRHEVAARLVVEAVVGRTLKHLDDGSVEGVCDWRICSPDDPAGDGVLEVTRCTEQQYQARHSGMEKYGREFDAPTLQRFWELRLPGEYETWEVPERRYKDVAADLATDGLLILEAMERRGKFSFHAPSRDADPHARMMAEIGIASGDAYSAGTAGGRVVVQQPGMSASISAGGVVRAALQVGQPKIPKLAKGIPGEKTGDRHLFVWIEPGSRGPWMWIGFHKDEPPSEPAAIVDLPIDRLWIGVMTYPDLTAWSSDGSGAWEVHSIPDQG